MAFARIVTHYWGSDSFLDDGVLMRDAYRLAGIPGVMVHGRADVSGPADFAWRLAKVWPDAELIIVDRAGHGTGVAGVDTALLDATNRFAVAPPRR
jgi:proline iminopeptidase